MGGNPGKSLPLIYLFDSIFSVLVHYSLILKISPAILRIFLLFSMSSLIEIITKSNTQNLSIHSLNNSDKNFFCFEYLLSYYITSFHIDFMVPLQKILSNDTIE